MPRYDVRCPEGHVSEIFQELRSFKSTGHICKVCSRPAKVVILGVPFFHVDNTRDIDYVEMAGKEARHWTTKKDRDRWLESQNRWIPDANDPKTKEAFSYLDQIKEERMSVEAKGDSYAEYVKDRDVRKKRDADERMNKNGISIQKMSPTDAQKWWAKGVGNGHKMGCTDDNNIKLVQQWQEASRRAPIDQPPSFKDFIPKRPEFVGVGEE